MRKLLSKVPNLALALAAGVLGGCSAMSAKRNAGAAFAAPTELSAVLTNPINIDLSWRGNATNAAGYVVEWTGNLKDGFLLIALTATNQTSFRHADLMPEAKYIYRVRPYFGPASDVAEVRFGDPAQAAGSPFDTSPPPAASAAPQFSLRKLATAGQATPTHLSAKLISPTRARLTWEDRATDEEGYFLEARLAPHPGFIVLELMPPDTTSFDTVEMEPNSRWEFRVRPFFQGKPSAVVEEMTGPEPATTDAPPASSSER